MDYRSRVMEVLKSHKNKSVDMNRKDMIEASLRDSEVIVSANGALATWTEPESTGRSPKDTLIVKRDEISNKIDWDSSNNIPVSPDVFDLLFEDAISLLSNKKKLYETNRVIGAESNYALPVKTISDTALSVLFTDNMFRKIPDNIKDSIFSKNGFLLIALPSDKLNKKRYKGKLRKLADGSTSDIVVVSDFANGIGIVIGSAYLGSIKKMMFTVMNYMLPEANILPLHTSANEGKNGDIALFLGLSGTGKTTLSADPNRALLGDDEHGWDDKGIANFENGCYAKLINLDPTKEPEIYGAVMHKADYLEHGTIVENAMIYPNGVFDFYDSRFTQNSRCSYPLNVLSNIKESSTGDHPKNILFLTADANGVLPPISKLTRVQVMLWFLMGYTSKLAGTERGIKEPVSTFSRFFGEPFMPLNPDKYASLLGKKMKEHGTSVYLINTGWSGGPYGVGKRMDIGITRSIINSVLDSELSSVEYFEDSLFHIMVPKSFPNIDINILHPEKSWHDKEAFRKRAEQLAKEFSAHYDKVYGNKNLDMAIKKSCPGK